MRSLVLSIPIAASILVWSTAAIACPCSPCTCSPCTCDGMSKSKGQKPKSAKAPPPEKPRNTKTEPGRHTTPTGGKRESHHKSKEGHGGHSSHADVSVGVDIDLSGIGRRYAEPDPFAVSGPPPMPHTQEKPERPKTKERQHEITKSADPFSNVSLTGPRAKDENAPPPGSINTSDDTETPPTLPTTEVFLKSTPPTIEDLKKAQNAYDVPWKKFLEPYVKRLSVVYHFHGSEQGDEELRKLRVQFAQSEEGKKLLEDWMKTYQAVNKPGAQIPDDLVPPNELEKAKHSLAKAQQATDAEREVYDAQKKKAIADNAGVKRIQTEIDSLKKETHFSDKEVQEYKEKLKKLEAALDNLKKQVGNDWASSDEAKDQMQKIREAEKQLNKAKDGYKPYEQFEEKPKAASNP